MYRNFAENWSHITCIDRVQTFYLGAQFKTFIKHIVVIIPVLFFHTDTFTGEKDNRKTRNQSRSEGIQNQHYISGHVLQQRSVTS